MRKVNNMLWIISTAFMVTSSVCAKVMVQSSDNRIVMENEHILVVIAPNGGGRIQRLVDKATGVDAIALWKGDEEIGGALDDRLFFTRAHYRASVMQTGDDIGVVRLEASHPTGLSIAKVISLRRGDNALIVSYAFTNATQKPQRLWVRNFIIPNGAPLTDAHLYWMPLVKKPIEGVPFVSGYYANLRAPWTAIWERKSGNGIIAIVPGVERFYFWQGAREFPTFEWLYPETPAGKRMTASLALAFVHSQTPPDWDAIAKARLRRLKPARFADIQGWVDEATKFKVTTAERKRGFWLSVGIGDGKRRLPTPLQIDLPRDDSRAIYIGINVIRNLRGAHITAKVDGYPREHLRIRWEVASKERIALVPITNHAQTLIGGMEYRLWLDIDSHNVPPKQYNALLTLTIGDESVNIPLAITIWDVRIPPVRPFHVRGYCGGIATMAGGYEVNDATLKRLDAMLRAYAGMGGDVLDWTVFWARILEHVKVEGMQMTLAELTRKEPQRISLKKLPHLDFSYYDPWLAIAKRYGVKRIEAYMEPLQSKHLSWRLLTPAIGKGRVKVGTQEATMVIAWVYRELKRYFERHGFNGFFCKISDEISPERIASYIETAKVARSAGWRPFTTITGLIARTAKYINAMNPHCDEWQVSLVLKDDFLNLIRTPYRLITKRVTLTGKWSRYTNGGARDTWAIRAFGDGSVTGVNPKMVETLTIFEDGNPLELSGGSPWGNRRHGIAFTGGALGEWLYIAPSDRLDPNESKHRYELEFTMRIRDPRGKPLANIDHNDEIWFYGGSSRPFRTPYESSAIYPLLAFALNVDGFGWWAFCRWQPTENIVWYDSTTGSVTVGPTYLGLRDGYRDACLFHRTRALAKRNAKIATALRRAISEDARAILRIDFTTREAYRYRTIVTAKSPCEFNDARRTVLKALVSAK